MKKAQTESAQLLRVEGLRATSQRVALLGALRASSSPESVGTIIKRAHTDLDTATAYRALQEFERAGLARRIVRKGGPSLYESVGKHHHHLTCRGCGLIEDVEDCLPKSVHTKLLARHTRFARVEDHALEFFGLCTRCAKM